MTTNSDKCCWRRPQVARSRGPRSNGVASRILSQLNCCLRSQSDRSEAEIEKPVLVTPLQSPKARASLPETHSSSGLSEGSQQSFFDESFYRACVRSSGSLTADSRGSPDNPNAHQKHTHDQLLQPSMLRGSTVSQPVQPVGTTSHTPRNQSPKETSITAVDKTKVAKMLDALVIQQPLFMSSKYIKLGDLNRGASGFVQLAQNKETRERVAIKFITRGEHSKEVLCRELVHLSECGQHPNIVQLKEVFLTPHHLGIAMEYVDGGDLARWVQVHRIPEQGLPESNARWLFQQIALAVDFCHRLGIAIRDIKLDNCLIESSHGAPLVKLCDFGYSKAENFGSGCKTACGTPEYMAPEVLTEATYKGNAADVWSLAVMLYVMIEGAFPFRLRRQKYQMQKMIGRIVNADYKLPIHASTACQELLASMLRPNPAERITVTELLRHPWFLTDLPPGTQQVNERLEHDVRARVSEQTRNEIRHVVDLCNDHAPIMQCKIAQPKQHAAESKLSPGVPAGIAKQWAQQHELPRKQGYTTTGEAAHNNGHDIDRPADQSMPQTAHSAAMLSLLGNPMAPPAYQTETPMSF